MLDICFIVNPKAGRGKALKVCGLLQDYLRQNNITAEIVTTKSSGHAIELAFRLAEKHDTVVAVGGDGTINEVANGLIGKNVSLGCIPVGTGNDFVKALNIPLDVHDCLKMIFDGNKNFAIDIGLANNRYFVNGLGIGFDAWVVKKSLTVQKLKGNLVYLYSVLSTLKNYKSTPLRLAFNGKKHEMDLFMLTIGNGPSLGGGFRLTPNAITNDGLLDLCIIPKLSRIAVYKNLFRVYGGTHINDKRIRTDRTDHIKIETQHSFAAHADGEILGYELTTLDVKILPHALNVICPL